MSTPKENQQNWSQVPPGFPDLTGREWLLPDLGPMIMPAGGVRTSGAYFWAKKAGGATSAWSVLASHGADELCSALASAEEDVVSCGCSRGWENPTPVTAATNHSTTSLGQKQEL